MQQPTNVGLEVSKFFAKSTRYGSTYKSYLFKSLLDLRNWNDPALAGHEWISDQGSSLKVDLNFVAPRFAIWYWPLFFTFKLRQSPHPTNDVHILPILLEISNLRKETSSPSVEELCSTEYSKSRRRIISTIKRQALERLQKNSRIYEIASDSIIISKAVTSYFKENYNLILTALNFTITEYLEGINQAPNIAEKVLGGLARTVLRPEEFTLIKKNQNFLCFYCGKNTITDQEHVIPWNYIYDTKSFNIVGACTSCNSMKNDKLPRQEIFERVLERNRLLFSNSASYSEQLYRNIYSSCKIEYNHNEWSP